MIRQRRNRYVRLKSTLLNSQIQQDNPALYEVINQILEGLQDYENFTGEVSSEISRIPVSSGGGGGGGVSLPSGILGDILYHDGDNWAKLPIGTPAQFLMADGSNPLWQDLSSPGVNIRTNIYRSTNLVIDTTAVTPIPFNTEIIDTHDLWSISQPERLTITEPGIYVIHAAAEWFSIKFGSFYLIIRKNGVEQFRTLLPPVGLASGGGYQGIDSLTVLMQLVEDDYIESCVQWAEADEEPAELIGGQTRASLQINNLATHSITIVHGGGSGSGGNFQEIVEHGEVGASRIIDWSLSDKQIITLNTAECNITFTNPPNDRGLLLLVRQDNVGNRKINWDSKIAWPYQIVTQPSGIADRMDLFTFMYVPSLDVYIASFNQNYKVS